MFTLQFIILKIQTVYDDSYKNHIVSLLKLKHKKVLAVCECCEVDFGESSDHVTKCVARIHSWSVCTDPALKYTLCMT